MAPEPAPKPQTHTSSGLDYDAELALPMPKPKPRASHLEEISSPMSKSSFLSMPKVTKKRSTTEPALPSERNSKSEGSDKSEKSEKSGKKKSKVATLRSKFSFKDIGKEFRKEIPPLSSMPKFSGVWSSDSKRASSDEEIQSTPAPNFNEAKLYVPRARKGDVQPYSAPAHTSEFSDATSPEKMSEDSTLSWPPLRIQAKNGDDGTTEAKVKHSATRSADGGRGTASTRLEGLLHDGLSPPARTGELNNTGQAELIQVQDRVPSMEAESNQPAMPVAPSTPPLPPRAYSPSIYDTPKTVAAKASLSSLFDKVAQKPKHPFIVSSSSYNPKACEQQTDDQLFLYPREAPVPPLPTRSLARDGLRDSQIGQSNNAVNEAQYFTDVTGHGGYAPPPPHPGYQNTVTMEQQLASHVDSLHYHLNTAVNKISRTSENNSHWSTDQILKQVDAVSDLARVLDIRTAAHGETIKDVPRLLADTNIRINNAQKEIIMAEERVRIFVRQEVARLRSDLTQLILSSHSAAGIQAQAHDSKWEASYPGGPGGFRPGRDGDKRFQYQNKRKQKPMQMKRDDWVSTKKPTQESKPVPVQQTETTTGKEPDEQGLSNSGSSSAAAVNTPDSQTDGVATPSAMKRGISANDNELSESPKTKDAQLGHISSPKPTSDPKPADEASQRKGSESNSIQSSSKRESESQSRSVLSGEDLKTPKKKGGMFSGFRRKGDGDSQSGNRFLRPRTPRHSKEGKYASSQESQSPRFAISAPMQIRPAAIPPNSASPAPSGTPTLAVGAGGQTKRAKSPSLVHPALRNEHQRQIMADRERTFAQLNRQVQTPAYGQAQGHGHPFPGSQSHHDFGREAATSLSAMGYELPKPPFASGIASSSSFRDVRPSLPPQSQHEGQLQYFSPPPVHLPPTRPDPGHGHDQGQFDDIEWYGGGNGSINSEAGYRVDKLA